MPDPDVDERARDGHEALEREREAEAAALAEQRAGRLVDVLMEEEEEPVVEVAPDVRWLRGARVVDGVARHRRRAKAVHLHRSQRDSVHHCVLQHTQTEHHFLLSITVDLMK